MGVEMKKIFTPIILGLILFSFPSKIIFSQQPEKVYSIVKQIHNFDWYKTAAEDWEKLIDKNKTNAEAWMNYYIANRMARMMYFQQWKNSQGKYFEDLDTIVQHMEMCIPGTFEYYYIKYYNSNSIKEKDLENLFKAYKLEPNRPELFDDMVMYYEIKQDKANEKKFCLKWFESNDLSPNILNWNYNVLMSLEKDGIIITNGDNDTFPIWIIQYVKNIRPDIAVININLITIDDYRNKLFKECNIDSFNIDTSKFKNKQKYVFDLSRSILNHILLNSKTRPVYLALTLNPAYYENYKDKIYMVGLGFKYSEKDFDNIAYMINNYEHNWLLDYLVMDFSYDISSSVVNQINNNYLPVFAKLYEHFKLSGEENKMSKVKLLAKIVAEKSDALKYYNELFK